MAMTDAQLSLARQYLADPGTTAEQSIQIDNATSGTFTISFDGQTTSALAFSAGANDVQNALCALSNIGVGGVNVVLGSGIVGAIVYNISFAGDLQNSAQAMFTVSIASLNVGALATVTQLTAGGVKTFSDADLAALYTDAQFNFYLAICYGFRVLLSNAAKFNDYVAGQSQEKKSQIYKQIAELANLYEEWSRAAHQVQFVSLVSEPPRLVAVPWQTSIPANSLVYAPPYGPRAWGRRGWR